MAENRFKSRQEKRTEEQNVTLAKASGHEVQTAAPAAKAAPVDKTPVQVYMTKDMKKRLKMYCVQSEENMTSVIIEAIDEYLKGKGC